MVRKYFLAWFGMMVLAIVNGGIRDYAYKQHVDALVAHQISTLTLIILMTVYFWFLTKTWPIQSANQAWFIGTMWFMMTEVFEFGMGLIGGQPWNTLFYAYNVFAGQVWILIPLWVLVGPYIFYRYIQIK